MSDCDRESSTVRRPWPTGGLLRHTKKKIQRNKNNKNFSNFLSETQLECRKVGAVDLLLQKLFRLLTAQELLVHELHCSLANLTLL